MNRGHGFLISYDRGSGKWSAPCFITYTSAKAGAVLGVEKVRWIRAVGGCSLVALRALCSCTWQGMALKSWTLRALFALTLPEEFAGAAGRLPRLSGVAYSTFRYLVGGQFGSGCWQAALALRHGLHYS